MNPINDSICIIESMLYRYRNAKATTEPMRQEADDALETLKQGLSENTPLALIVEAFCSEVEQVVAERERRGKGGQHVPLLSQLNNVGPSALAALERYARDFRAALERKPEVFEPVCDDASPCGYTTFGGFVCGAPKDGHGTGCLPTPHAYQPER